MNHLLQGDFDALKIWLQKHGYPAYRAGQVQKWLYVQRADSLDEMTDLPQKLRDELASDFQIWTTQIVMHTQADDGTEKLLLELADGQRIECVLLRTEERRTICISTQVGCAMGCVFCASGIGGVERNLTSGEIIEQMLRLQRLLPADERLSNIVVMGMGEPLANLDNLLPALDQARSDHGLGISARRIVISTVGLPKAIDRLAKNKTRYLLAVSLHATNDELRNRLVPVNKNIGLDEIMAAGDRYFESSGRRLTYEYVLLAGVNDSPQDARQLVALMRGRSTLLNVIPYNPVAGLPYRTPSSAKMQQFREILEAGGVMVKFRQRKGDKIDAACGQLRREMTKNTAAG